MSRFNHIKRTIAIGMTLATIFTMSTTAFAAPAVSMDTPEGSICYQQVSQDMAMEILKQYVAESPLDTNSITTEREAASFVDGYVQYAVDNGYIADTPEQRADISKALARGVLSIAANAGGVFFPTAGDFLNHSLQDNPGDLTYGPNSTYAQQIQESSEFDDIVDEMIQEAENATPGAVGFVYYGTTSLDSTTDLLLAYRAVSYTVHLQRPYSSSNDWTAEVVFRDTYDFDSDGWSDVWEELNTGGLIAGGAEVLNMVAEAAMDIGAIVEYDIRVTVETSFTV